MKEVIFFDYESKFSTRLRDLLEEKGISKQKLSEEIGVSRQAISQYCDGSTVPNADKFFKIADFFGVSLDYLVGKTESKTTVDTDEGKLIRSICDYVGLNERAVRNLAFRYDGCKEFEDESPFDFLNYLLAPDTLGFLIFSCAGDIKNNLIEFSKVLKNGRENNIEKMKKKTENSDINENSNIKSNSRSKFLEFDTKHKTEKEIDYGKYEIEKAFRCLIEEFIKEEEIKFKEELNRKWQL